MSSSSGQVGLLELAGVIFIFYNLFRALGWIFEVSSFSLGICFFICMNLGLIPTGTKVEELIFSS